MKIADPISTLDYGLLTAGEHHSRFLYRVMGFHPVLHRHIYRFVVTTFMSIALILMVRETPSQGLLLVLIPLMLFFNGLQLRKDMPAIRRPWDQKSWKYYTALAGMAQDNRPLRLFCILIMTMTSCSLTSDIIGSGSFNPFGWYVVAAALFIVSIYVEDAYPPEPDEGEPTARFSMA